MTEHLHGSKVGFPRLEAPALKVCHVVATTEGAAWLFEQVRDLRDRYGCEVTVILSGQTGTLVDRFNAAGVRVLASDFNFLGTGDLLSVPKKIMALTSLLRREKFDVVQTHLFHSMVIGRLAAWLADVPVRLSMVAGPFHLEAYTPSWIDGSTQWMETALIPSCEFSRSLYRSMGVDSRRLHVIYYGPDETRFDPTKFTPANIRRELGWDNDVQIIGMVAYFYGELGINRWTPPVAQGRSVKCQADLIKAMPSILEEFPKAKLVFVGSGWEESGRAHLAKMQALVADLHLDECVRFIGFRKDVPEILKNLDVAVQASVSENLGGSIEALLMEVPLVATRVGGLVDSVIDDVTGILAEPGDPESLAFAVRRSLRCPEYSRKLAKAGRSLMLQKFTLRTTVDDEYALYRRLLGEAPAGYRVSRIQFRRFAGVGVAAYLALRYRILDAWLLPKLDSGWRPWHMVRLRFFCFRVVQGLRRRLGFSVLRLKESEGAPARFGNDQFASPMRMEPPPLFPALRTTVRMTYSRGLSAIGRLQLGWGLRAKVKGIFASWRSKRD